MFVPFLTDRVFDLLESFTDHISHFFSFLHVKRNFLIRFLVFLASIIEVPFKRVEFQSHRLMKLFCLIV